MNGPAILRLHLSLALLLLFIGGCQQRDAERPVQTDPIEKRLIELEERIEQLSTDWQQESTDIYNQIYEHHEDEVESDVRLDCSEAGYSWLRYRSLLFPVVCEGVHQHLDGIEMSLKIGNPYSASFAGVELAVSWKSGVDPAFRRLMGDEFSEELSEEYRKGSKTVSLNQALEEGAWNHVDIVVSPAKVSASIRMAMSIGSVALRDS